MAYRHDWQSIPLSQAVTEYEESKKLWKTVAIERLNTQRKFMNGDDGVLDYLLTLIIKENRISDKIRRKFNNLQKIKQHAKQETGAVIE